MSSSSLSTDHYQSPIESPISIPNHMSVPTSQLDSETSNNFSNYDSKEMNQVNDYDPYLSNKAVCFDSYNYIYYPSRSC